jgi:hypothetical protein
MGAFSTTFTSFLDDRPQPGRRGADLELAGQKADDPEVALVVAVTDLGTADLGVRTGGNLHPFDGRPGLVEHVPHDASADSALTAGWPKITQHPHAHENQRRKSQPIATAIFCNHISVVRLRPIRPIHRTAWIEWPIGSAPSRRAVYK